MRRGAGSRGNAKAALAMSAGRAAEEDDGATGEQTGRPHVTQNMSVSLPAPMMTGPTHSMWSDMLGSASTPAAGSTPCVPRKRRRKKKGCPEHLETPDAEVNKQQQRSAFSGSGSGTDDQQVTTKCFRRPHSQIEKRRRDKMNSLIDELSAIVPRCAPVGHRLDRLTVLRMAVQHLRTIRGAPRSVTDNRSRPRWLPEEELKQALLKAADSFVFVVSCDRGKVLFASESISMFLHYNRLELIGQSLFDYIHPKDIAKVKEQLSPSELFPNEKLKDVKSGLQGQDAQFCTGARRSFFCRMKQSTEWERTATQPISSSDMTTQPISSQQMATQPISSKTRAERQSYCTVHFTGYLRSWPACQLDSELDQPGINLTCLVAVGRSRHHSDPHAPGHAQHGPAQFVTRCTVDGKFTFIDQRATTILGFLPQEVLGTSCYEYFHPEDLWHLSERHREVLLSEVRLQTQPYRFRTKHGSFLSLQSEWFSFRNPWTKEVEFIVSTNTVISDPSNTTGSAMEQGESSTHGGADVQKVSLLVMGAASGPGSSSIQLQGNLEPCGAPNPSVCEEEKEAQLLLESQSKPEPQGTSHSPPAAPHTSGDGAHVHLEGLLGPGLSNLSNDEAAMAILMSFLETDVGVNQGADPQDTTWPQ